MALSPPTNASKRNFKEVFMTNDQLSRINIKLQLLSDKNSGLHTGKMTTTDAVQICREIVEISDEGNNNE